MYRHFLIVLTASFAWSMGANAQNTAQSGGAEIENAAVEDMEEAEEGVTEVNPDEMADMLNSQQQLQQSVTLTRTINGEVVETDKRTIVYSKDDPYRQTEAALSTTQKLLEAFDGELLTRTEAFEEAKLDFTIADANRDGLMTADEFANLVDSWREEGKRSAEAPTAEIARQRQYDAFLKEIDPNAADLQTDAYAKEKFKFMAGVGETITREDYIREYLLDFDSMDENKDTLLRDEELMRFRAVNRGETIEM